MFDLVPVDHDPFADPPFKLIPVDHDPFAVGPAAQSADPAIAGAGTAAPQLVPVDHDPFAPAPAGALPRIVVHPKPPNALPDSPAGADGPDDWFVPMADGYPDDWFVPAPLATPGSGQSGPSAQSNAAVPPVSNPPAVRPDPSAAFWSLIPASRAGAFAWHPPIFPNSAGQFPPLAPAYDSPVLPVGGLFGGIGRKLAASVNGPGIGYGLFGSPVKLRAANTDAPPSILGAGSNSAPSSIYPPYLGGSALPSYLADPPPPPNQSPFALFGQLPDSTTPSAFPLGSWSSRSVIPFQAPVTAVPPPRSIFFNQAPMAWDPGAPDRNAANLDQTARTLGIFDLPLSKSSAPVVSPPPQLTITPQQLLAVAHLVSPNLVDYFTKTLPPAPPLPSTPGKILSDDSPYGPGAAFEAATWLLGGLGRGIVGPLEGAASAAERSATEAALQAAKSAGSRAGEQIATGSAGTLSGTLSTEALGRITAALRAAVDSGNLTEDQAGALLRRAKGGAAELDAPLSTWLPKFDKKTTYGLLITNEGDLVPLQSGKSDRFWNYPSAKHTEGKGAIWIGDNNSSGGVLFHNNTGGTCGFCDVQLERLLPNKAVLDVVPPADAVPKNEEAVATPSGYEGDEILPRPPKVRKPPRPIQQPDFFREQP